VRRPFLNYRPTFLLRLVGAIFLVTFPLFCQPGVPTDEVTAQSVKFARIYQTLEQNYVTPLDPDRLILEGAVRGMLSSLDPFSSFFDQQQFEALQEQTSGEAIGFGSILYVQPGKITVIQTQQGSPSWRAGLSPGDQIVAVDGFWIDRLGLQQIVPLLEQAKTRPVHLSVVRPGDPTPEDISMKPAKVNLPTVDIAFRYPSGIGYVHVASFEARTPQETVDAIKELGAGNLKGLVVDLRNNPGGLLSSAVAFCSLFLKPGERVLTVEGRAVPQKAYQTLTAPLNLQLPLIVLVNGSTASAAEVVTAALQDHDRALIVGEPTFGKGVVESVMPLSGQMGLALLTAEYFTPSGRSIQKPLPGTALQDPVLGIRTQGPGSPGTPTPIFRTDNGRRVMAGGGITPDVPVPDWKPDDWLNFLNGAGMFTSFASQYVSSHGPVSKDFEPDSAILDAFRTFLENQRIRSPNRYWSQDQQYMKVRIRTEVFNLVFGLNDGNRVAAESDPQVQRAVSLFPKIPGMLKGPAGKTSSYARGASPRTSEVAARGSN
jgi:carboxyl-terminal processing protease